MDKIQTTPKRMDSSQAKAPLSRYKILKLERNTSHNVYICYTTNGPQEFWVQLEKARQKLSELNGILTKIMLEPLNECPPIGTECIGRRREQNCLGRCVIVHVNQDDCTVLFVDYGNVDNFGCNELYKIPSKHLRYEVMAMRYSLAGTETLHLTFDVIHTFRQFFNNRLLKMVIVKEGTAQSLPTCSLYDDYNINALDVIKSTLMLIYFPRAILDRSIDIVVTSVCNCNEFYVQEKSRQSELRNIYAILQQCGSTAPSFNNLLLKEDLPCCAKSPIDGKWHRAKVLEIKEDIVTIKYVDYGDEETVKVQDLKRPYTKILTTTPPFAIRCSLYGFDDGKNTVAVETLRRLVLEKEFKLDIIKWNGSVAEVNLFNRNGISVASLLKEELDFASSCES